MWQVTIDLRVRLEGCPESGMGAVDFRRAAGLPEEPTADVVLRWSGVSEVICRRYPGLVDGTADLSATVRRSGYSEYELGEYSSREVLGSDSDSRSLHESRVSVEVARPFLAGAAGEAEVIALVDSLAEQAAGKRAAYAAAKAVRAAEQAAEVQVREQAYAAKAARMLAGREGLAEWVRQYGSELARLRLEEGYDSWVSEAHRNYGDHYAGLVAGDLVLAEVPDGYEGRSQADRESPTVAEILAERAAGDRLAAIAGVLVSVELVYCTYTPDSDSEDYDTDAEDIHRCELRVTVTCPDGVECTRDYLIPQG